MHDCCHPRTARPNVMPNDFPDSSRACRRALRGRCQEPAILGRAEPAPACGWRLGLFSGLICSHDLVAYVQHARRPAMAKAIIRADNVAAEGVADDLGRRLFGRL
jgi:hypothetical protein